MNNLTWNVTNLKVKDQSFSVNGESLEDAVCNALLSLGWNITLGQEIIKSEDEFITSSELLVLAKKQSMELSLCLNGFFTKRFLSKETDGAFSHNIDNGETLKMSREDFLRVYPNELGKVWRITRVENSVKPIVKSHSLMFKIKKFISKIFSLTAYLPTFYMG